MIVRYAGFWIVVGKRASKNPRRHLTLELALAEAVRLAGLNSSQAYFVHHVQYVVHQGQPKKKKEKKIICAGVSLNRLGEKVFYLDPKGLSEVDRKLWADKGLNDNEVWMLLWHKYASAEEKKKLESYETIRSN